MISILKKHLKANINKSLILLYALKCLLVEDTVVVVGIVVGVVVAAPESISYH